MRMKVEKVGEKVRIELEGSELLMLRRALERASFIDTPAGEQTAIASFCAQALDALPPR